MPVDGSDPTISSTLYTGFPIPVLSTTILRAKAFDNDSLRATSTASTFEVDFISRQSFL
ncbi:MAG: chitobiase/beta-hexosaminidase C-terminal domain-containing protein [Crocinitomicaceae bacterium]|nr:chitobiase/beta-hexosaminidase C-terminal domain-containing protein [Crocinitomicaceae bacterium]